MIGNIFFFGFYYAVFLDDVYFCKSMRIMMILPIIMISMMIMKMSKKLKTVQYVECFQRLVVNVVGSLNMISLSTDPFVTRH